jgi:ribonuclease HI
MAEYQALILGLHLALDHGERHVVAKGDSRVVVNQVKGEWKTKEHALLPLRTQAEELLKRFKSSDVKWISRKLNRRADELGRGVMSFGPHVSIGGH